ncbi:MAG: hypothetical protein JWM20_160 [Patescibacteria group bacterium]|nr:hypothetical protein [Patescibacteria group bacterium]
MNQVFQARKYNSGRLFSGFKASYMILRQHKFPWEYPQKEEAYLCRYDSDRVFRQENERAKACAVKYVGKDYRNEYDLVAWIQKARHEKVISFIQEFIEADSAKQWTGYRIMLTMEQGWPILTLEMYAQTKESNTKVYSRRIAPNVEA